MLADIRREEKVMTYLRPDGKAQVTVEYEDDKPLRIDTVVVSTQHAPDVSTEVIRKDIMNYVINTVLPKELLDENTKYYINPTGRFVVGGPQGDTGLTGRKIIVDTYGGYARHGGGAFSGKDATKVDRSGAYMARFIAKNIVAAGFAQRCQVTLAYAIGEKEPVMVDVNTFGTGGPCEDDCLSAAVRKAYDLTPAGIIKQLNLLNPMYSRTAAGGHFGREDFPWENIECMSDLAAYIV